MANDSQGPSQSDQSASGGLRREAQLGWLIWRFLTAAGNKLAVAVTAGASSVAIVWDRTEPTTVYGVTALPNWSTTVYLSAKSTTGITLSFGTAAPGGGGTVDVCTFKS